MSAPGSTSERPGPPRDDRSFSQVRTDSVSVRAYGPVSVLSFDWSAAQRSRDEVMICSTAARLADRDDPVDAAAELTPHVVLTGAGLAELRRAGSGFIFAARSSSEAQSALLVLDAASRPTEIHAVLAALDRSAVPMHTFAADDGSLALWRLDAPPGALPVRCPISLRIFGDGADLDDVESHLAAHPAVLSVDRQRFAHTSSGRLEVVVQVTEDTWAAMCAYATQRHGFDPSAAGRPPAPSPATCEGLLMAAMAGDPDPLGDPLGLARFARPNG